MTVTIKDPAGHLHTLSNARGPWVGWENIAHTFEPSERAAVIEQLLLALQLQRPTLPLGFEYATPH